MTKRYRDVPYDEGEAWYGEEQVREEAWYREGQGEEEAWYGEEQPGEEAWYGEGQASEEIEELGLDEEEAEEQ